MKTAKKILIISGDYPPRLSGIADYTHRLASEIARTGADVSVLTTAESDLPDDGDFRVIRSMPIGWPWNHRQALIDACAGYDVINIQYPSVAYGRAPLINLAPWLIHRAYPQCKVVTTMHDFRVMTQKFRARALPMLWASDALIYVSIAEWDLIRKHLLLNRHVPASYIPIAANAEPIDMTPARREQLRIELGAQRGEVLVSFFGILYPHKGIHELVSALQMLRDKGYPVRLVAIADFDRQADYVAPITEQLSKPWTSWVRGARLTRSSECLHAADIACVPDYFGAATNRSSMLAGLAHGLPTVATIGTATPANIRDFFDLELVPSKDAPALSNAIEALLNNADRRAEMSANAKRQYARFSWATAARSHTELFDSICEPKVNRSTHRSLPVLTAGR